MKKFKIFVSALVIVVSIFLFPAKSSVELAKTFNPKIASPEQLDTVTY